MLKEMRGTLLFAVAIVAAGLVLDDRFYLRILTLVLLWAVAGAAWNLTAKAGQISLGHSAFTGLGAYTFALLLINFNVTPWLGLFAAMAVAVLAAVIIGVPSFRLRGFYFTLGTIAYPLILILLTIYLGYGELSIPFRPDRPWYNMQFRDQRMYVWIALVALVLVQLVVIAVERNRFGYYLRAIRDNEVLAQAIGVRTDRWKLAAFALSAALTAAMGVLWVNSILLVITAEQVFGLLVVIQMLSVVFVGGIASRWGPIVGSVLLVPLALILDDVIGDRVPGSQALIYGLALVIVALIAPAGIVARVKGWTRSRADLETGRETAPEPDAATPAEMEPVAEAEADTPPRRRTPSDEVVLAVRDIQKSFGGLRALDGVSLDVHRNELLGIIGPNGAGKTTLFNVLTGYLPADSGTVEFDGEPIQHLSPPQRYQIGISRTFQVPQGFPRMTPRENILVAAMGAPRIPDPEEATARALDFVGLTAERDADLAAMSTLEFKLLEIGRAMASRPTLLLVDEPLAGLNSVERSRVTDVLRRIAEDGATVVVIEHSVRALVQFSDRIVALDHGAVIASGRPEDVIRDRTVVESYLGRRWTLDAAGQ